MKIDRCPAADSGYHWEISSQYPISLCPSQYASANVFGVLLAKVEQVFDNSLARKIIRDENLIEPVLAILYRSNDDDYWLAKLSWHDEQKLLVTSSSLLQKYIAIASVPEDMKNFLSMGVGLKALLKLPSQDDLLYKVVGVQVKNEQTLTSIVNT